MGAQTTRQPGVATATTRPPYRAGQVIVDRVGNRFDVLRVYRGEVGADGPWWGALRNNGTGELAMVHLVAGYFEVAYPPAAGKEAGDGGA